MAKYGSRSRANGPPPYTTDKGEGGCAKFGCAIIIIPTMLAMLWGSFENGFEEDGSIITLLVFVGIPAFLLYVLFKEE